MSEPKTEQGGERRDGLPEHWYSVYTDDEDKETLLQTGRKWNVFATLKQFHPQTVLVVELDRDDQFGQVIESLNGEEWLRQNSCPICERKAQP